MTRVLFLALQEAAAICRASSAGPRMRRLSAEIDLLRAAVAISAVEPADDDELATLARLVFGVRVDTKAQAHSAPLLIASGPAACTGPSIPSETSPRHGLARPSCRPP